MPQWLHVLQLLRHAIFLPPLSCVAQIPTDAHGPLAITLHRIHEVRTAVAVATRVNG